jgi:predicted metalloprotease
MSLRTIAAGALVAASLFAVGCGDDDSGSSSSGSTAMTAPVTGKAKALTDVAPRAAKANVVGGDAPIAEFARNAAGDAVTYWTAVFEKSGVTYAQPSVNVLEAVGDNGCGEDFDPDAKPFFLCAEDGAGTKISLGGSGLDGLRTSNGDAAVVFLAGLAVALDANDQLSGNPIVNGKGFSDEFVAEATCFVGAWIRNLDDRKILEAGDDAEILDAAGKAIDATVGPDQIKEGFTNGVSACQGGGAAAESGDDSGASPSPTP